MNNEQPFATSNVLLFEANSGKKVNAEVWYDITEQNLADIAEYWVRTAYERGHWDWRLRIESIEELGVFEKCSIVANGVTQAVMLVSTNRFCRDDNTKGLVFVDYVQVAPWNQDRGISTNVFKGVGTVMLSLATRISKKLGFEGRLGLHSLPQAKGFYKKLGMRDYGLDSDYYNLAYFELTVEQAEWLIKLENQND